MALFNYIKDTERFLRDANQRFVNPENIQVYVNRGRREIALRTQCIRVVPPISGPLLSLTVVSPGSGYTNPTLTISTPDSPSNKAINPNGAQATGTVQQISGGIASAALTFGGDGYFQPTCTVNDPHGHGAVVTAQTVPLSVINEFQETYNFSDFPVQNIPGIKAVFGVLGVSSLFNNLRYSWIYKSFSEYQAFIRTYTSQYFYTPAVWTQYGQGVAGSLLCYPIPSQPYQWEPDCLCLPTDLQSDADFEAIPEPWTDCIAWVAAALAYQEMQALNNAEYYWKKFEGYATSYGNWARISRAPNPYPRRY